MAPGRARDATAAMSEKAAAAGGSRRTQRGRQDAFFLIFIFLGGIYKRGGRIWKDLEINGIGVHDVKFSKNQLKKNFFFNKKHITVTQNLRSRRISILRQA